MPEGVEGFLEREGTHGLEVVFEQFTQFGGLSDGEIARAFQETIAGVLENGFVACRLTSSMASPSFLAMWKRSILLS